MLRELGVSGQPPPETASGRKTDNQTGIATQYEVRALSLRLPAQFLVGADLVVWVLFIAE
jgi:hypothetical protein